MAEPAARRSPRRRPARLLRVALSREAAPFVALVMGGLALRVIALSARPMHHDESIDGWFAWRLSQTGVHHYDPTYHGPLRFYLVAGVFRALGASDFTARLLPAILGSALIALPYFIRRQLGRTGALAAAALLCISPSFVYYSRFAREDIYVLFITALLIVLLFGQLESARRRTPVAMGALLAAGFATKETTFITVFQWVSFSAVLALVAIRTRSPIARRLWSLLRARMTVSGTESWLWAATAFLAVFTVAFTGFFTYMNGLHRGLIDGLGYWLGQHSVHRGGQPWFYYLLIIATYELPILVLAVVGALRVKREPSLVGLFLVWSSALGLVIYAWAGEKYPWLVLHQLLPLVLLGALGAQAAFERRARRFRLLAGALALAAVGYSLSAAVGVVFRRPAEARELLVAVQTSRDVPHVLSRVQELDRILRREDRRRLRLVVDSADGATWPWAWYLRDLPAAYRPVAHRESLSEVDALLVTDAGRAGISDDLGDFVGRRFRLRVHWLPRYSAAGVSDWVRWVVRREPWERTGSVDAWLYVRRQLAGRAAPRP
jgi:uncharacterized protein (TIGR03663 family)